MNPCNAGAPGWRATAPAKPTGGKLNLSEEKIVGTIARKAEANISSSIRNLSERPHPMISYFFSGMISHFSAIFTRASTIAPQNAAANVST